MNKTDITNRAIQVYAHIKSWETAGAEFLVRHPDGRVQRATFL